MARKKRTSKFLDRAVKRSTALKSISASLDLGGGITVSAYDKKIAQLRAALEEYNSLLSSIDARLNAVVRLEKEVRDFSERALAGVAAKYGKDADEYEKAGGTRKSERKRPVRRKKSPPA